MKASIHNATMKMCEKAHKAEMPLHLVYFGFVAFETHYYYSSVALICLFVGLFALPKVKESAHD